MQEKSREPALMDCLSFRDIGDHSFISAARHDSASRPPELPRRRYNEEEEEEEEGKDEGDFEFALVLTEETIAADDIFSDGRIRPLCPLDQEQIRRALGKPQRVSSMDSASTSSEVDELEGVAPGTYCAWEPPSREEQAQGRCKKSSSTGNLRRWRIRDLVPRRSRSDEKERFMFLTVGRDKKAKKDASDRHFQSDCKAEKDGGEEENKREKKKKKEKGGVKAGEWDMAAAHCVYYGQGGEGAARRGARRSFLPYKQDVVGFFGRTHPPG